MLKFSATICLVLEMKSGPFLFSDDFKSSCSKAAVAGFDAVDLIIASSDSIKADVVEKVLAKYGLRLGAVGTGAGFVCKGLSLTCPDKVIRQEAIKYIAGTIDFAGKFGASVIIGSMQGRIDKNTDRASAYLWLKEGISYLAEKAEKSKIILLFEPLNRYETNVINKLEDAIKVLNLRDFSNFKLLADTFHMNIEEQNISEAFRKAGGAIAYVHIADSNRCAAGLGHLNFYEIAKALKTINYNGFISAEILPYPDEQYAAMKTIETFNKYFIKDLPNEYGCRER
ncbi:MAG: TIM barrel protein [Sedimentisphaerales bacterium]